MPTPTGSGGNSPGGRGPSTYVIPTTGPVTPKEIYELLIQRGLSTNQAIGVMANMFYESSLNPEAGGIDSNGFWAGGLISWNTEGYTNARMLVTGDPQKDVRAQMAYLFNNTDHLSQGLQGATAADVAHNWAQFVENCAACYPGGQQWTARGAYTSVIGKWVTTGNWPAGGKGFSGAGGGSGGGSSSGSRCLVNGPSIPFLGSTGCLLSASQARAVVGAGLIAAAIPVGLVGFVVLAAFTFRKTGAGGAIGKTAEAVGGAIAVIPGAEPAGLAVAAAGSAEARKSRQQKRQRDAADTERKAARAGREADAQARNDEALYQRTRKRTTRPSSSQPPPDDIPPF